MRTRWGALALLWADRTAVLATLSEASREAGALNAALPDVPLPTLSVSAASGVVGALTEPSALCEYRPGSQAAPGSVLKTTLASLVLITEPKLKPRSPERVRVPGPLRLRVRLSPI